MSSFSDLTPENTIDGATDGTQIGNISDSLKVSITSNSRDFYFDVVAGKYTGYIPITKYGRVPSISNNVTLDLTNFSDVTWLDTPSIMTISSTSSLDTLLGTTGAQKVVLSGLDSSYNIQNETVELNGTGDVDTTSTFLTVPRMRALTDQSNVKNQGDITAVDSGANVHAKILTGKGSTESCFWQVPVGYDCYILNARSTIYSSSGTGQRQGFSEMFIQSPGACWTQAASEGVDSYGGAAWYDPAMPLVVPEKTRVKLVATSYQNNTSFSGMVQFVLVPTGV